MEKGRGALVMDYFQDPEAPRIELSKGRRLPDIAAIAIGAVICGADSWACVEMLGRSREERFRAFLLLPNDIPSRDTSGMCSPGWTRSSSGVASWNGPRRRWTGRQCAVPVAAAQAGHSPGQRLASTNTLTPWQVKTEEKSNGTTAPGTWPLRGRSPATC